ncbi:hypothetical protein C0995_010452 [Termitomyces sp. Mi166|nr:hypothetical protein C0995_010452 [Termitomyces sp. Mi166\
MQPDWDVPVADEDDEDDGMHGGPGPQQIHISIQDILGTVFAMQSAGGPQSPGYGGSRITRSSGIALQDISRLLNTLGRGRGLGHPDEDEEYEEDDDDDDDDYYTSFRSAAVAPWKSPEIAEPQKEGVELLNSGDFGRVGSKARKRRNDINLANLILDRARRSRPVRNNLKEDYAANLIPNSNGTTVATCESNIYTGQYSADYHLHVFDTTKPPISQNQRGIARLQAYPGLRTNMKVRKSIQGVAGRWTITDANLSPDNERPPLSSNSRGYPFGENFGIWSCRFSADGNEVVAGGNGKIFVYDLLANRRTVKIAAHADDVNSCCWADTASGNVLVSASDDAFIKVWDRRSLGASQKPSGLLIGHLEGVTYVSAKGDGRYIVSNGKDQTMRLWDLRKMRSNQELEAVQKEHYGADNFDYRLIWSLDGRVVQVLDRSKTLPMSFDPSEPELPSTRSKIRACEPVIMSAAWEDSHGSTVARHEWKGLLKMRGALEDWVEKKRLEREETSKRRSVRLRNQRHGRVPGAFEEEEDAEEEDTE